MTIRTQEEREALLEAGRRFGSILEALAAEVRPVITTGVLDARAEQMILEGGELPPFKGYQPEG